MMKATMAIAALAILHTLHGFGEGNIVYYGIASNSLSLSFVDTHLSNEAKTTIAEDLQICLRSWGRSSNMRMLAANNYVAYLDNPKRCPLYPPTLDFPDNISLVSANKYALEIPKNLSDAYTNAFAFAAANSNIVAAAYQFVAFVSSPAFVNTPHSELPNYIFEKGATAAEIISEAADTIEELANQAYYPPSLLGFIYLPNGPAATNLWVLVPCSSPAAGGHLEWSHYPAIWHDNRWKFGFGVWQDE